MEIAEAVKAVRSAGKTGEPLAYADFEKTNSTAGKRSEIASHQADEALVLRPEQAVRFAVTAHETFTTNSTSGDTESFALANDLVDTPVTTALILFNDGSRVQPDSVDHSNDSFSYTDSGTGSKLDVYYVAVDPLNIEVVKEAPAASGRIEQKVWTANTGLLHEQNQYRDPPTMDIDARRSESDPEALKPVIPRKWKVKIYSTGPYAVEWSESTRGTSAENALLTIPAAQMHDRINGLSTAVKKAIIED